jgi:hypothetical protein
MTRGERWQTQSRFGSPDSEEPGDCFSACVASLIGVPLSDVPVFVDVGDSGWHDACVEWLRARGYGALPF